MLGWEQDERDLLEYGQGSVDIPEWLLVGQGRVNAYRAGVTLAIRNLGIPDVPK